METAAPKLEALIPARESEGSRYRWATTVPTVTLNGRSTVTVTVLVVDLVTVMQLTMVLVEGAFT